MRRTALDDGGRAGRGVLPVLGGDGPVSSSSRSGVASALRAAGNRVPQVHTARHRAMTTAPILARSRVRYAAQASRSVWSPSRGDRCAIDAVVRAAAWIHRPARRRGHLAAARAALERGSPHARRPMSEPALARSRARDGTESSLPGIRGRSPNLREPCRRSRPGGSRRSRTRSRTGASPADGRRSGTAISRAPACCAEARLEGESERNAFNRALVAHLASRLRFRLDGARASHRRPRARPVRALTDCMRS